MDRPDEAPATYRIVVAGRIDESWLDCFENLTVACDGGRSVLLATVPDQAALRGLVSRVWDLDLVLISVTRLPLRV
jgi:hypothetical protein